jgi:hypothetical protein
MQYYLIISLKSSLFLREFTIGTLHLSIESDETISSSNRDIDERYISEAHLCTCSQKCFNLFLYRISYEDDREYFDIFEKPFGNFVSCLVSENGRYLVYTGICDRYRIFFEEDTLEEDASFRMTRVILEIVAHYHRGIDEIVIPHSSYFP